MIRSLKTIDILEQLTSPVCFARPGQRERLSDDLPGGWFTVFFVLFLLAFGALWIMLSDGEVSQQMVFGRVLNEEKETLENARAIFLDHEVITDGSGRFYFTFQPKDSTAELTIVHPNYTEPQTRRIKMDGSGETEFLIVFPDEHYSPSAGAVTPVEPVEDRPAQTLEPDEPFAEPLAEAASSAIQKIWIDASWPDFLRKRSEFAREKLFLADVETYTLKDRRVYAGVWHPLKNDIRLWRADSRQNFLTKRNEYRREGFELTDIETYAEEGQRKFLGVWRPRSGSENKLWLDSSWDDFLKKRKEFAAQNFHLIDVEAFREEGKTMYIGIWEGGSGRDKIWNTNNLKEFLKKWKEINRENYRLIDVEIVPQGRQQKYIAIWKESSATHRLWTQTSWRKFAEKLKEYQRENLQLVDLEISAETGAKQVSGAWLGQ